MSSLSQLSALTIVTNDGLCLPASPKVIIATTLWQALVSGIGIGLPAGGLWLQTHKALSRQGSSRLLDLAAASIFALAQPMIYSVVDCVVSKLYATVRLLRGDEGYGRSIIVLDYICTCLIATWTIGGPFALLNHITHRQPAPAAEILTLGLGFFLFKICNIGVGMALLGKKYGQEPYRVAWKKLPLAMSRGIWVQFTNNRLLINRLAKWLALTVFPSIDRGWTAFWSHHVGSQQWAETLGLTLWFFMVFQFLMALLPSFCPPLSDEGFINDVEMDQNPRPPAAP